MNEDIERIGKMRQAQLETLTQEKRGSDCLKALKEVIAMMRIAKPEKRGELARRYAIAITDMEKLIAYFQVHVRGD
ncbi:MAG: hypothetical protein GY938_26995 [Ketobacter sp.]|nr:hypothetical protein [Ketobacter sp.]